MKKILFMLLMGSAVLMACGGEKQNNPAEEDAGTQMAEKVSIFSSKDNQKEWLLEADSVDFSGMEKATLKKPHLLLNENGEKSAEVSGDMGVFDYTQKLVSISGNAQVVSFTEKLTITAAAFFYQIDTGRIWSDSRTTIVRGTAKSVARGGIVTDSHLKKIELKKQSTRVPKNTKELERSKKIL